MIYRRREIKNCKRTVRLKRGSEKKRTGTQAFFFLWAYYHIFSNKTSNSEVIYVATYIDCKTVRIFEYSNKRKQSWTRLKTETETGRDAKNTVFIFSYPLAPRFTDFFTDFEKKTRLFCSLVATTTTATDFCFLPFSLPSPFSIARFYFWFE